MYDRNLLAKNMRQRGLKENSTSFKILVAIGRFFEETIVPLLVWDFDTICRIRGFRSIYGRYPRPLLQKSLHNLKRRNYIKETKTKKGRKIELTKKGWLEIIKYKIKSAKRKLKWNGKWFGIAWDVPEISRKDRDYLRRLLKWLGFKEVQKSFWIYPYDVRNELKELFRLYKEELLGDVRFLIIEKIENDSDLKKYFNLK